MISSPGWEDVSLAAEGVKEAQAAGRLLKEHGFTFDVVYTRYEKQSRDSTVCARNSAIILVTTIHLPALLYMIVPVSLLLHQLQYLSLNIMGNKIPSGRK